MVAGQQGPYCGIWGAQGAANIIDDALLAADGAENGNPSNAATDDSEGINAEALNPNLYDLPAAARTTTDEQYIFQRLYQNNDIDPTTSSTRLHEIKAENGLAGDENVTFDLSGGVYDTMTGEYLGSLTQGGK